MAGVLAERLGTDADDPRARMVAAVAMAALRTGLERWVAGGGRGDPAAFFEDALRVVSHA